MTPNDRSQIEIQLELLLKVVAALTVGDKRLSEGAQLLDRLGVDRALIAAIYDTSQGSVRAALSQAKKTSKTPRPKGTAKKGPPATT